jgi:hypothetical protein
MPAYEERRAELRVPASTLGEVKSRLIGGSEFALLNYTSTGIYGQSPSRLLVGARVSVRLATATLDAVVRGRVVRSSLTAVQAGVPRYEVAVSLEQAVDWSPGMAPVQAPVEAPIEAGDDDVEYVADDAAQEIGPDAAEDIAERAMAEGAVTGSAVADDVDLLASPFTD